jgi:recombination protein RecR
MNAGQPTIEPVARLIEQFARLPGIGPKTAQRLTYYLLRMPAQVAEDLAEAIGQMKASVQFCAVCLNIAEAEQCAICRSPTRDKGMICIVEEPMDVLALERTRGFKGVYHVLHGALSPIEGIGPDDLKIRELLARIESSTVTEVILATNPSVEGEATALYLHRLLRPLGIKVTQIARGLPVGGDLEYADEVTLARALEARREMP